jgi:hypothetical protein
MTTPSSYNFWDDDERSTKNLSVPNSAKEEDVYTDFGLIIKEIAKSLNSIEYCDDSDEYDSDYDEYDSEDENDERKPFDYTEFDKPTYCSTLNRTPSSGSLASLDNNDEYVKTILNESDSEISISPSRSTADLTEMSRVKFFYT